MGRGLALDKNVEMGTERWENCGTLIWVGARAGKDVGGLVLEKMRDSDLRRGSMLEKNVGP